MAELFDIVVRRQIYIEGLKAAKGQEFALVLSRLRTQLAQRLSGFQYDQLGNATKTALRKLIVDLRAIAKAVFDPYLKALIDWLQRFCRVDTTLLRGVFGDAVPDARTRLQGAPEGDDLWALAIGLPMAATGTLALPFLGALLPMLYVKIERLTLQNYANQSTRDELIRALVGNPNSTKFDGYIKQLNSAGNAATNTVLQHLANQISNSLGEKVAGWYEWVSVLDDRTTKICISRDGNRYVFGQGPVPPAHVNCRSTIVPVNKGDRKTPSSYNDWVRTQPDEFVADALDGRRRARYEGSSPLSLTEYGAKSPLIGA
jgi:SPP1 gp7 family putative phage head morphogenesis protein